MDKQSNKRKNEGFSLIELIIAISILVILTGMLAPGFMRQIERSREAVCRKNMDEILNMFRIEHVLDDKYELKYIVKKYQGKCPSSGTYSDATKTMGLPWIFCSVHDAEEIGKRPDLIWSEKLYNNMVDFVIDANKGNSKDIIEELKKVTGKTYISNDTLREYLYVKNGGEWPKLDKDILMDNGIYKDMYIQPYLNAHVYDENGKVTGTKDVSLTKPEDVILFARANGSSGGGWSDVTLIYNHTNGKWYQAPPGESTSVYAKSWPEIEKELEDWTPLK